MRKNPLVGGRLLAREEIGRDRPNSRRTGHWTRRAEAAEDAQHFCSRGVAEVIREKRLKRSRTEGRQTAALGLYHDLGDEPWDEPPLESAFWEAYREVEPSQSEEAPRVAQGGVRSIPAVPRGMRTSSIVRVRR